ncbi:MULTISPECIES: SulP family inorganic anion transporter [Thiorhodovibrio]|uniref:SulP family inorganic anion transporter n=1 Tax=Thiorhodovibrio TaxID=61593 RepID=UPI001913080E|nr:MULTISPECIES: SulP family inorganic anion transporter [Thiorhodovibrio]MBK5967861.1 sodium-independent anion transporter [Thiorhodovibrio winogradskyi]WPL14086.1 putative sulfate transporter [Thiorhodovibrio litoralis]
MPTSTRQFHWSVNWSVLWPFARWLPQVTAQDLRADMLAALTGAIIVLPQGVAFATIAGMPPEYGLYAGMVPAIIAAFFGSSRHLVSGPTTAASVVLFSSLSLMAAPGTPDYVALALTLTFMVGVIELALGFARLGALVNFISHSVVVGFTAGAAFLIAAKQLKHFFGIEMDSGGHFHDILIEFGRHAVDINPYATLVGVITLAVGILVRRCIPKFPYMIAAMLCGSVAAVLFDLVLGPEYTGIATVGALPASLPPLSTPDFSLNHIKELAPTALAVTLFALTEAVSIGRSLAARGGYRIDGNQEFIGQGLSNIAGAFFSGYVATGSFNRSGVNFEAGARTPLAAVFAALLLMVIVLLVAPLASYLPKAAMAGVLFLVAWGLIDRKEIRHILHASPRQTAVVGVTFFSALFLELEFAIFAGVLLSLVLYLERTSKPRIVTLAPDPRLPKRAFSDENEVVQCPQVRFIRIDGSLFFGSVAHVERAFDILRARFSDQKHLAIMADGINFVDLQGAQTLLDEADRRRQAGGSLYLINVKPGLWERLDAAGCLDAIGVRNVFQSKEAAVRGIYQKLDRTLCETCEKRIFIECGPPHHFLVPAAKGKTPSSGGGTTSMT